ncbi:MAG: Ran GTPase-activating protein (RanGAP) involved in mRNA processing and transport [Myxococcota bacterium]|jgi:Ran GTPase-activating protein (RanGAP) involved in mRNA processing and transport
MNDLAALSASPESWSRLCAAVREEPDRLEDALTAAVGWEDALRVLPWSWRGPLLDGEALPPGLIRSADLSRLKLGGEAAGLLSGPVLGQSTRWDLSDNELGAEGVAALVKIDALEQVTSLGLYYNDLKDDGVAALLAGDRLGSLRELDLSLNDIEIQSAKALAAAKSLAGLERLNLNHGKFGGEGFLALLPSPCFSGLTHLSMIYNETSGEALEAMATAPGFERLESLKLDTGWHTTPEQLAAFANSTTMPALRTLRLSGYNLEPEHAAALANGAMIGQLRSLVVDGNFNFRSAKLLAKSAHLTGLEHLSLRSSRIKTSGAKALAKSAHLAGLKHLELFDSFIDSKGLLALAGSPHLANLTALNLGGRNLIKGPEPIEALTSAAFFPRLESLSLGCGLNKDSKSNRIGPEGIAVLASAPVCALKTLSLDGNDLEDAGLEALAGSIALVGLEKLDLRRNSIGPRGVRALADSPVLSAVRELDLGRNSIGGGLVALAASPHVGSLQSLRLSQTALTRADIRALADSENFSSLTSLSLECASNMIGLEELRWLLSAAWMPQIEHLILRDCRFKDAGAQAISESPAVANLRYLNVNSCFITAVGHEALENSSWLSPGIRRGFVR